MLRVMLCSIPLLVAMLVLPAARADAASGLIVKTRTSCDMYGRCFEFSGPNDSLVSDASDLWHRSDPMALATGTAGDPVVDPADE